MLRRLGIRGKVLAALSVPVLVLVLLAGFVSLESVNEARTARTVATFLTALEDSRDVVTALQAERRSALPFTTGQGTDSTEKESARETTDQAIAQMERSVADVDFDTLDPQVRRAVNDVDSSLDGLTGVRGRVDANVPLGSIIGNYTTLIKSVVDFPARASDSIDDRRLAAIIAAHTDLMSLTEDYHEEQVVGSGALMSEREPSDFTALSTLFAQSKVAHQATASTLRALELGEGFILPPLGASFSFEDGTAFDGFRTLLATGQKENFTSLQPEEWTASAAAEITALDPLKANLRVAASQRAGDVASVALRTSLLTIAAAVAAVVLSIAAALAIARQIIVPLRRLTEAAGAVRDELPRLVDQVSIPGQGPDLTLTRIPVTSKDEIGQLATAFNEVNTTTIQVAQEQAALRGSIAEMFVNVARRDQILLNRQLSFIDALERSEEDPKTLADLFRLDHLATRMRRNAESLLVLAGIDTGRRLRETLALSDVIRTASSEIEHYERVQLDLPIDPMMLGHTALPAAHMMAELLENATVFSEPGTPVQVSTGVDEDHVIITILDQGLGMTPSELEEANSKIRATSASDVLGSQRLGMFVVGRIASRLGATAELGLGPDGTGTLATIRMPRVLFVDVNSLPMTPTIRPGAAVETFVLPDEAAEVAHDTAYAPAPRHTEDVPAGALGSSQNPAEEVDLEALTDGTTDLGLPRRRNRPADAEAPAPSLSHRDADDAAAAPSIPLAPKAEALAGAAGAGPVDDGAWMPPVIQPSAPLSARRPAEPTPAEPTPAEPASSGATSALPTRQPAAGLNGTAKEPGTVTAGLPVRSPALPSRQPAAPVAPAPAAAAESAGPANPEGRSATFRGFRSRRAELAAAAVNADTNDSAPQDGSTPLDGAERLAAAAATATAFFGRSAEQEAPKPLVIPSLVDDDDEFGGTAFSPDAPVVSDEPAVWAPPVVSDEPAVWAPPVVEHPMAEQPIEPAVVPIVEPTIVEPAVAESTIVEADVVEPAVFEPAVIEADVVEPTLGEGDVQEQVEQDVVGAVEQNPRPVEPAAETGSLELGADGVMRRRRGRHARPMPVEEEPEPLWAAAATESEPAALVPPSPVPVTWEGQETPQPWAAPQDEANDLSIEPEPAAAVDDAPALPWLAQGQQDDVSEGQPTPAWQHPESSEWAENANEGATSWPPAPVPVAAVDDDVTRNPFGEAPQTTEPTAAPIPTPAFTALVHGGPAPAAKPAKRRFGLFGRKRAAAAEPVSEPVDAYQTPFTQAEPSVDLPSAAPVRQSAWNSTDIGAHALPQQVEPSAALPSFEPAPFEPAPFEPAPFEPAPFEPSQPASAAFAPPTSEPPAAFESVVASDSAVALTPADRGTEGPAAPTETWQPPVPAWQASAQAAVAAQDGAPEAWAPTAAWEAPDPAAPAPLAGRQSAGPGSNGHTSFNPQTTFTPHPTTGGAFDDEVTNMLAQRADLAQQALAELSQLSSYRPKAATGGEASTLVRRTPGSIPAAPAIEVRPAGQQKERDANQVRSLISSFQSGTNRGRQASDSTGAPAPGASQDSGADAHAGHEDGPEGRGEPVTTPDTDLTQRSTSW